MKYKRWERRLLKGLGALPKAERARIAEYYREMYAEMTGGGRSEESVLAEFGSPEKCAEQVLREEKTIPKRRVKGVEPAANKTHSAAEVAGLILFTLFIGLPLGIVAVGILITFGALCLSGGALGIAGLIFAAYYPFVGTTATEIAAGVGVGIGASGAGLLLLVGFFYATKGLAIALGKTVKAVYGRR